LTRIAVKRLVVLADQRFAGGYVNLLQPFVLLSKYKSVFFQWFKQLACANCSTWWRGAMIALRENNQADTITFQIHFLSVHPVRLH
jgi:hypothetical protein